MNVVVSGSTLTRKFGALKNVHSEGEKTQAYDDLCDLLKDHEVIFLSGDIHENKFDRHNGSFIEITSSGAGRYTKKFKQLGNYGLIDLNKTKGVVQFYKKKMFSKNKIIKDKKHEVFNLRS